MGRQRISTNTIWEERVGYSRAVRVDIHVFVTGTMAIDEDGTLIGPGDIGAQTRAILEKISRALKEAGSDPGEVVRCRIYVTDIDAWEAVADVHREVLGAARPATTMVEVSRLAHPEALVEIEVDAMIGSA
jgi:enamine deaminase RidA (YjgF/YER057c/UK114 family)